MLYLLSTLVGDIWGHIILIYKGIKEWEPSTAPKAGNEKCVLFQPIVKVIKY